MKKLLSLVTVFLCVVLLSTSVFAATTPEAYELYLKYVKKSQSMKSMETTVTTRVSATVGNYTTDLSKQSSRLRMMTTSSGKIEFEMKITDSDTKQTMNAYYRDNYLYLKMGSEKYKIKMSANDALSSYTNMNWWLTKDAFKGAKVEAVEGGYKISYKTDIKNMTDANGKPLITSLIESLDMDKNVKTSYTNLTSTITAGADGTPMGESTSFSVKLDDGKDSVKIRYSTAQKITSFNSIKKIDFPSDLSSYLEIR